MTASSSPPLQLDTIAVTAKGKGETKNPDSVWVDPNHRILALAESPHILTGGKAFSGAVLQRFKEFWPGVGADIDEWRLTYKHLVKASSLLPPQILESHSFPCNVGIASIQENEIQILTGGNLGIHIYSEGDYHTLSGKTLLHANQSSIPFTYTYVADYDDPLRTHFPVQLIRGVTPSHGALVIFDEGMSETLPAKVIRERLGHWESSLSQLANQLCEWVYHRDNWPNFSFVLCRW